ncbi:heme o synthase [Malassezia vespertilionis]|uniref:heme o synthase n=1 Tax=Malassezia vespertilionis TaxID=2020962 RepID=UPI0024B228B2|nr:heme o synthase [Malassezia vespertilionis]WFD04769.1 heme o synthase [Malassezia vespertilionis]
MRHPTAVRESVAKIVADKYKPATDDPMCVELLPSEPVKTIKDNIPPPGYVEQRRPTVLSTLRVYRQLSKLRLTFLVVLTGMMGYVLCPASCAAATTIPPVVRLLALASGIALCSTSANTLNQIFEAPYDAQMARTKARPLPRRAVSPGHAYGFALASGLSGVTILVTLINPLTAALGALNIVLYSFMYTPMKRLSIANTWVGALVGALPPLMGWASCTGTLSNPADASAWVLAGILFAWQFPHFNALSYVTGNEYARGGYRMMAVTNPALNRRVALRYAIALIPLCSVALPLTQTVQPMLYATLSLIPNLLFTYYTARFWRIPNEKTARACFWFSLVHLPAVMLLAMSCKYELWQDWFTERYIA